MNEETFEQMALWIAHRVATYYRHGSEIPYMFSAVHIGDFARKLKEVIEEPLLEKIERLEEDVRPLKLTCNQSFYAMQGQQEELAIVKAMAGERVTASLELIQAENATLKTRIHKVSTDWQVAQAKIAELTKQVEVAREALVRISANDVFDVLPKHRIAADALATLKGDVSIPDGWTATECKYCGSPCIERPMPENKHGRDNDADIAAALKG